MCVCVCVCEKIPRLFKQFNYVIIYNSLNTGKTAEVLFPTGGGIIITTASPDRL
jgi:hypothetical protein